MYRNVHIYTECKSEQYIYIPMPLLCYASSRSMCSYGALSGETRAHDTNPKESQELAPGTSTSLRPCLARLPFEHYQIAREEERIYKKLRKNTN